MIKVLGINSDTSTCECCGKTNLKKVVTLQFEDGRILSYGTTCAAKALRKNGQQISKSAIDDEYQAIAYIQKWIGCRDAKVVASATWDRFGFRVQAKNGGIYISLSTGTVFVGA